MQRGLSIAAGVTFCLMIVAASACKTSGSSAKSAPDLAAVGSMNEADFITACQQRLNDANEGVLTAQMLQQYAQTSDCKTAYPRIMALVNAPKP